jgi:predicted dithiol-disulfide oxidoreductase (DUF899 family)
MNAVATKHEVVSELKWVEARKALLVEEKELTRRRDELSRKRRELPWTKVEKKYAFHGPDGKQSLSDLFAGRNQLIIYHFMLGPGWTEGCKSCSYLADHFGGALMHLAHRDTSFAVVSRAPSSEIETFKKRMGWQFKWVSSNGNDFNFDYNVSFPRGENEKNSGVYYNYAFRNFPGEEAPGLSVFYKDENGDIFHTYSTYGRGLDILLGTYNFLDLTPKGRDEDGLPYTMAWIRHHDRYDKSPA